ncbi:MAG: hypothetical protein FJX74_25700, partial [Armatimonadetes bacterium]|nr:hypothetical protein [Armatimonadota bacterium]
MRPWDGPHGIRLQHIQREEQSARAEAERLVRLDWHMLGPGESSPPETCDDALQYLRLRLFQAVSDGNLIEELALVNVLNEFYWREGRPGADERYLQKVAWRRRNTVGSTLLALVRTEGAPLRVRLAAAGHMCQYPGVGWVESVAKAVEHSGELAMFVGDLAEELAVGCREAGQDLREERRALRDALRQSANPALQ